MGILHLFNLVLVTIIVFLLLYIFLHTILYYSIYHSTFYILFYIFIKNKWVLVLIYIYILIFQWVCNPWLGVDLDPRTRRTGPTFWLICCCKKSAFSCGRTHLKNWGYPWCPGHHMKIAISIVAKIMDTMDIYICIDVTLCLANAFYWLLILEVC